MNYRRLVAAHIIYIYFFAGNKYMEDNRLSADSGYNRQYDPQVGCIKHCRYFVGNKYTGSAHVNIRWWSGGIMCITCVCTTNHINILFSSYRLIRPSATSSLPRLSDSDTVSSRVLWSEYNERCYKCKSCVK